jgi:hypothetical protein
VKVDVVVRYLGDTGIKWERGRIDPITSDKFPTGPCANLGGRCVYKVTIDIVKDHLGMHYGSIFCSGSPEWFVRATYEVFKRGGESEEIQADPFDCCNP